MKTNSNYFKIFKTDLRAEAIIEALREIENTVITPSINYYLVRTPSLALCSDMYELTKKEYYDLISPFQNKPFYSIESENGLFKVWVSRPVDVETIITTSFNIYDFPKFTSSLLALDYIHLKNSHKAENFCSIRIELLEPGALTKLMEDLAELLAKDVARDLQAVSA